MVKIDERFIKEKINPVVGFIFNTARQLGIENAPASMDMEYLRQGTEKVRALIEETAAEELSAFVREVEAKCEVIEFEEDVEAGLRRALAVMRAVQRERGF